MRYPVLSLSACVLVSCAPLSPVGGASSSMPSSVSSAVPSSSVYGVAPTPMKSVGPSVATSPNGVTISASPSVLQSSGPVASPSLLNPSPSPIPSQNPLVSQSSNPASPAVSDKSKLLAVTGNDIDVSRHKLYQGEPRIGIDQQGRFVVVWYRHEDANQLNVYAQRFLPDGSPQGSVLKVNSKPILQTDSFHSESLQVAMANDGSFAVLFAKSEGLFLRTYSNQGWPLGEEANIAKLQYQADPTLAALSGGQWAAAWRSDNGTLEFRRFDESGKALGVIQRPFSTLSNNRLAVSPSGSFLLASQGMAQRYDERGIPVGSPFSVPFNAEQLSHSLDKQGHFVTATHTYENEKKIVAMRYDQDGKPIQSLFQANQQPLNYGDMPQSLALVDALGRSVILWGENYYKGAKGPISLRRFDAAGQALEAEYQVNSLTEGFTSNPAGAINAAGHFVVAWQNWNDNQGEYRILAKVLDLNQPLPALQTLAPEAVDCSKAALESVAPSSRPLSPEQEALKQQILAKPVYTGPIEIKLKVGTQTIDPRTPGALNGLPANTSRMGSVLLNGKANLAFENGVLIVEPRKSGCFTQFRKLYGAEIEDQLSSYFNLRLTLTQAPLDRIEELLRAYNKGIAENLTSIEFSSLETMQTFLILLDILSNNAYYLNSIDLNIALMPG